MTNLKITRYYQGGASTQLLGFAASSRSKYPLQDNEEEQKEEQEEQEDGKEVGQGTKEQEEKD